MGLIEDAKAGNYEAVVAAIQKGDDVNATDEYGNTPLMCMASQGQLELCEALVKAGADPYAQCKAIGRKGWVAMDFALQVIDQICKEKPCGEYAKIVKLLEPPDPEDDEERGAAELEERLALERQSAGKLCAGVKLKHQQ